MIHLLPLLLVLWHSSIEIENLQINNQRLIQMFDTLNQDKQNAGLSNENKLLQPSSSPLQKKHVPCLASAIQEHLIQQNRRLFEEEIFKESVVKCSLDKDFAYLFEESGLKIKREIPQAPIANTKKPEKVYNAYERTLQRWFEEDELRSLMYLPFSNSLDHFDLLNERISEDKLVIVVTDYHQHFSEALEEINSQRRNPIRWAALSSTLNIETKSKILELYELRKLKLLLLTPELFEKEKYQHFCCEVLMVSGVHLFEHNMDLLQRIIKQTEPQRVLGCYEYLTRNFEKRLNWHNYGREYGFENTMWLKGDAKCKNLLSYLSKREHKRVIIVTRDKRSADDLSSSLSLEAYKTCNFTDLIPRQVFKALSLPGLLTSRKPTYEDQLHEAVRKACDSTLIVSPWFQGLRLIACDLVVFYDQPSIKQYMQMQSLSPNRLGLLSDEDYYICRNLETSSIVDRSIFERLVQHILNKKQPRSNEKKVKRFYSDSLDNLCDMDPVTSIKSIKVNQYCEEFEVSKGQLLRILELMADLDLLTTMDHVKYECLIEERSAEQFRTTFPLFSLLTRRVNILSLASHYKTTTQSILDTMKSNNIRFLVCEELIPVRLLQNSVDNPVEMAWLHQQQEVLRGIRQIDLSYTLFDQFTFPNTQFLRRDKILMKKKEMVYLFDEYLRGQLQLSKLPLLKINNVNRKTIQEWVQGVAHEKLTVHDIVLFLQGTLNQRTSGHQDDAIFKSFYKCKYEELAELVTEATKNKRRKIS